MNLANRDQQPGRGPGGGAGRTKKEFAVAFYAFALIVLGEAKIETMASVGSGVAARTGAECMDQPRNALQVSSLQDLEFRRFCGAFSESRHIAILNGGLQPCRFYGSHRPPGTLPATNLTRYPAKTSRYEGPASIPGSHLQHS